MKPIYNKEVLMICPKIKTCRNDRLYSPGVSCGHHIPHPNKSSCSLSSCQEEENTACITIEEVLK